MTEAEKTIARVQTILQKKQGRLMGLPHNCTVCGVDFVGDIVFAGVKDDEFADLPCDWKDFKMMFGNLWEGTS